MAAASVEGGMTIAQRAAQATARGNARSAVLQRFDAADARRRFDLDQAAEARADRAAGIAKGHAETRASPERTTVDDRRDSRTTACARPADSDRADDAGSHATPKAGAARSAADRDLVTKPTTDAAPRTATADMRGEAAAVTEIAPSEGTAASDAKATPEAPAPAFASGAQPTLPTPSVAAPADPPRALLADAAHEAEQADAATPAASTGDPGAKVSGAVGEGASQQPAVGATASPPDAATSFSAVLDLVEPPAASTPSTAASSAAKPAAGPDGAASSAAAQATTPPVPLGAVPMTIALRSLQNASRFEIRLDPVELGRIDVRLDIDKESGAVSADLVVDRPATLALLQRDSSALQHALAQAGLDASAGIGLSLRDAADGGRDGGQDRDGRASHHQAAATPGAQRPVEAIESLPLRTLRLSGLDIRI